jgi:hypothetical protein
MRNRSFEVHFSAGLALALGVALFGFAPLTAFLVACAAGVAVETVQWAFPRFGQADAWDAIYTAWGGLTGALVAIAAGAVT